METLDAIHSRASGAKATQEPVSRQLIESLLEAAVRAPNHHLTEPWRFVVLTDAGRDGLGAIMEQVLVRRVADAGEAIRERERAKPLRAPVVIAVTSAPGVDDIETIENYAATCAAIENLLLAAHDPGLAAHWRTGDVAYSGEAKVWLGVPDGGHIAGFIYVGHAVDPGKARPRISAREKTEWRE